MVTWYHVFDFNENHKRIRTTLSNICDGGFLGKYASHRSQMFYKISVVTDSTDNTCVNFANILRHLFCRTLLDK